MFTVESGGEKLRDISNTQPETEAEPVTISGELNKLAANISIARNMAGVHYYTDYYESLRMGERVSTGILLEHLTQMNEPVEVAFHSFDGDHVHLSKTGGGTEVEVSITDSQGVFVTFNDWWVRHLPAAEVPLPFSQTRERTEDSAIPA